MARRRSPSRADWPTDQFRNFRGCVAFIETKRANGTLGIGTCFHVGDGSFVTARHVVEDREIVQIGFDDYAVANELIRKPENWGKKIHGQVEILSGPHFHPDEAADVACFKATPHPRAFIPLGGHFNDYLGQYDLVLHRTMVLGYPPIAFSDRPALVASLGEVNALIDKYTGGHPHFLISTMARGGFSGGPALVAYNENRVEGTAALGLVTESLGQSNEAPQLGFMAVLTVEPIYECLEKAGLLPADQVVPEA